MQIHLFIIFLSFSSIVFGTESECQKTKKDENAADCFEDENSIETGNIDESLNNFEQVNKIIKIIILNVSSFFNRHSMQARVRQI